MRTGWIIEMQKRSEDRVHVLLSDDGQTVVFGTEDAATAIASRLKREARWLKLVRVSEVRTVEVAPGLFVVLQVHPSPEEIH